MVGLVALLGWMWPEVFGAFVQTNAQLLANIERLFGSAANTGLDLPSPLILLPIGAVGTLMGVLPAGGEALDELEADEQDGRPDAEHGARRQDADAEGRQRHHHEGEGEDLLAPQAVPELAQDDAPQGPGHEGAAKTAREKRFWAVSEAPGRKARTTRTAT